MVTSRQKILHYYSSLHSRRKTMNFRFKITTFRFSTNNFTMRQIHLTLQVLLHHPQVPHSLRQRLLPHPTNPELKYLVADVPTYRLKVHYILATLHACCLTNRKFLYKTVPEIPCILLLIWPYNTHFMGHHVTMLYTIFYLPPCRPLLHVLRQRIPYPNDALSTILIIV
jgi:hypothetical protein